MKANQTGNLLLADDILNEIEIELIQGNVSQDDLGRGLQEVRHFHGKTRSDFLAETAQKVDYRAIANRQFQINEMLLTLFQETIGKVQALQVELRKSIRFAQQLQKTTRSSAVLVEAPEAPEDKTSMSLAELEPTQLEQILPNTFGSEDSTIYPASSFFSQETHTQLAELKEAMSRDQLALEMDMRANNLPVIGGILTRLRSMLHSLALFYVNRLGNQQASVNQLYGDWLLQGYQLTQTQQREINALRLEVAQLKEQIKGLQAQM